jgi:hypothetical protein
MPSGPRISAQQRQAVIARANGCCEYCLSQARFSTDSFSIEHIIPRSLNGPTELSNLALACQGCNNHKYNKIKGIDPISNQEASLFHPRRQKWSDHFAWSADCSEIVAQTAVGRVTIAELKLNRIELVNLRRLLYAVGEHPPVIPELL